MKEMTFSESIKTNVTPETKTAFQLLAHARGVKPSTIQREAFSKHIKNNAPIIRRLRARKIA
jgi:hypothetical protein